MPKFISQNPPEPPACVPDWYWIGGLHDALLLGKQPCPVAEEPMPEGCKFLHNCLELQLDAAQAMFDRRITALKFYNFKELTPEVSLDGCWWVSDRLTQAGGKYCLEVQLRHRTGLRQYQIRFEVCRVLRENRPRN